LFYKQKSTNKRPENELKKIKGLNSVHLNKKLIDWLANILTISPIAIFSCYSLVLLVGGWQAAIYWEILAVLVPILLMAQFFLSKKLLFSLSLTIVLLLTLLFPAVTAIAISEYHSIAKSTDMQTIRDYFKSKVNATYDYKQLIIWEWNHIQWLNNSDQNYHRNTDPIKIFEYGEGQCMEFAILYAALCDSQGYQCRIVAAPINDHAWTEVLDNGTWTRVDSSLGQNDTRTIGYPMFFEKEPNWTAPVIALAFDGDKVIDVTASYRSDGLNPLLLGSFTAIVGITIFFTWKRQNPKKPFKKDVEPRQSTKPLDDTEKRNRDRLIYEAVIRRHEQELSVTNSLDSKANNVTAFAGVFAALIIAIAGYLPQGQYQYLLLFPLTLLIVVAILGLSAFGVKTFDAIQPRAFIDTYKDSSEEKGSPIGTPP
jgi:hypothetical protein